MEFIPAGEIIGDKHQIRTVRLADSPHLPDGDYTFIDFYCTDTDCDCRKTIIQVMHNGRHVSTISYGWEPPEYYRTWMGSGPGEQTDEMSGATIDITSPDLVSADGMLRFFHALLSDQWIQLFKWHYSMVKKNLKTQKRTRRK